MLILLLLCCLFTFSCSQPATLGMTADTEAFLSSGRLETLAQELGYRVDREGAPDFLAETAVRDWENREDLPAGAVEVRREVFVPRVPLTDLRTDISLAELAADHRIPLISPDSMPPGAKSLKVDGCYPDDPRYPLIRRTAVLLTPRSDEPVPPELASALRSSLPGPDPVLPVLRIASVGDMMLQRGIEQVLLGRDDGAEMIFGDTLGDLAAPDLLTGNLEGAVTLRGTRTPKTYNFRFLPDNLPLLKQLGFDYLAVTNNHSFDWGLQGFRDTLAALTSAGIGTSGAGNSLPESLLPWLIDSGGQSVAVYSLGAYPREQNGFDGYLQASAREDRPGILWNTPENLEALAASLDHRRINVILVHGGREWRSVPDDSVRELYRRLVDMGFQVVFGSHPHVLQGMEGYREGLIYYSLGNFLFPGMEEMPNAEESIIAVTGFYGRRPLYVENRFVRLQGPRISLDSTGKIARRFSEMTRLLN